MTKSTHTGFELRSCLILAAAIGLPSVVFADVSASASAGSWAGRFDRDGDTEVWVYSTPTAKDTISWTSGRNRTDYDRHGGQSWGPETKFDFIGGGPVGRSMTGFTDLDGAGILGSTTSTSGSGTSSVGGGSVWGTNYKAAWEVTATGRLGAPSAGRVPMWRAQSEGLDPWSITLDQLEEMSLNGSGDLDLFIPVGLNSASLTENSFVSFQVSLETSLGRVSLLDISFDANGASVSGLAGLSMYRLSGIDEGPTQVDENRISMSQIESSISTDIEDGSLDDGMFIGIVLDGFEVPSTLLDDGSLAKIHVDLGVEDWAVGVAVPTPGSVALLGVGGVMACRRRRDRVAV